MIVAIIGADGSGKTTTAKTLEKHLKGSGYNVEFNKAFETYFLIKYISNNPRGRALSKRIFFDLTDLPTHIKYLWPIIVYLDQLLLYFFIRLFKRNKIVITDRYPYSFYVTWKYYGMHFPLLDLLYLNFPRPDACFVLRAEPEVLFERKEYQRELRSASYSLDFFKKHLSLYNDLVKVFEFQSIDTTVSLEDTLKCVIERLKQKKII